MKVFHITKQSTFRKMCKGRDYTYDQLPEYWGHIIVFEKKERNSLNYAHLMSIDGKICHGITQKMFHYLCDLTIPEHIYRRDPSDPGKKVDVNIVEVEKPLLALHI